MYTERDVRAANQAVFNAAWHHIRRQKVPSTEVRRDAATGLYTTCVYRADDGKGCAFSPCIANYDQALEQKNARTLLREHEHRLYGWAQAVNPDLATAVQHAHDGNFQMADFLAAFEGDMRRIATEYDLEVPCT